MKLPSWPLVPALLFFWSAGVASAGESPTSFRTIAQAGFSGFTKAQNLVITNQSDWAKTWQEHNRLKEPKPEISAIDFKKEMVLVAALGQQRTGGFGIAISRIEKTSEGLKVFVQKTSPKPGSFTLQVLSSPVHIISLPVHPGPIKFVEEK